MAVSGAFLLLLVFAFGGAGVLQWKFKGSGCSGMAAGSVLYFGIPTPLFIEMRLYQSRVMPSEALEFYIPLAILSIAAAGFAVLSAVKPRLRMWALLLASAASLPLIITLSPLRTAGCGLITVVPSFVFLFDALIGRFAGKNPWEPPAE